MGLLPPPPTRITWASFLGSEEPSLKLLRLAKLQRTNSSPISNYIYLSDERYIPEVKMKTILEDKKNRESASSSGQTSSSRQNTLTSLVRSKDLQEEFILDFLKLCTQADIPLEKVETPKIS